MAEGAAPRPIPLTLLTGFLGAGKTTLLNRLLRDEAFAATAVIVNEFGEIGLDHLLIEKADDGLIELSAGCICCTIRGELAEALDRLLVGLATGRIASIERVVVETTGLADPAPILSLLTRHPTLAERFRFDGVVTVVDARSGAATLDTHAEAVRQVAVADRIVLTKADIAPNDADALVARLKRLNPAAPVLDARREALPEMLIGCGPFDPDARGADVRAWMAAEAFADGDHDHHDVNRHDNHIATFALHSSGGMASGDVLEFLDRLEIGHASRLLRVKGILGIAEDPEHPVVIQGVQGLFSPPVSLPRWPDADRTSRIVFIGRDVDRRAIEMLFDGFTGVASIDTPDRQALLDNPLAIWRHR
ncbi:MAG: GTP-binding protein [Bauldia sp.]